MPGKTPKPKAKPKSKTTKFKSPVPYQRINKAETPSQRLDAIGIEAICEHVASGESLRSWTRANGFVQQTVINWIDADEDRAGHYAHARLDREDGVFDSLDEDSRNAVSAETAVQVAGLRLKSDNTKWKLARMNAKKFGDRTTIAGDADNPLAVLTMDQITANPSSRIKCGKQD